MTLNHLLKGVKGASFAVCVGMGVGYGVGLKRPVPATHCEAAPTPAPTVAVKTSTQKQLMGEELSRLEKLRPSDDYELLINEDLDSNSLLIKSMMRKNDHRRVLLALQDNVVYGLLTGENKLEYYEVYKKKGADELISVLKFGNRLNGHPGIVHGGITALLFDATFGFLMISSHLPLAVTAYLNTNYRAPVFAGSYATMSTKLDKLEGRKQFMSASIRDEKGRLLADCSTLFIATNKMKEVKVEVDQVQGKKQNTSVGIDEERRVLEKCARLFVAKST